MTCAELAQRAFEAQREGRALDADIDIGRALGQLVAKVGSEGAAREVPRELAEIPHGPLALLTVAALQALAADRAGRPS